MNPFVSCYDNERLHMYSWQQIKPRALLAIVNSAKQKAGQGNLGLWIWKWSAAVGSRKEFSYAGVLQQRFAMQM